MSNTNVVVLSGNLGREPELKSTQGGTQILSFSLAVGERRPDNNGNWTDYTNWVDCIMFGKRAESLSRYLHKGQHVSLNGSLSYSSWEKDGQRHSRLEVKVADIDFSGTSKQQQSSPVASVPPAATEVYDEDIPF